MKLISYVALSIIQTDVFLQLASRASNFKTSWRMKISIILALELAWTRLKNTSPSVSIATIMLILGTTNFLAIELFEPLGRHFILLKSVMPSQLYVINIYVNIVRCFQSIKFAYVSSTLIIVLPSSSK